jgi:UDP-glucuronate 4-epimerase
MSHYLVTGAAGFIASRVCEMLLSEGHSVYGIDNLCDAYDVRLKQYRLKKLLPIEGFTFNQSDICDRVSLDKTFTNNTFDAVINLAARAGVRTSIQNPWVFVDTNMVGTLNLLELCQHYKVPKFILASTSSIYGNDAPLPTPETAPTNKPLQPYTASKIGAEALCHAYHHLYNIDMTIFRYFTVYGPAGRPDMVMFRFAQWIKEGRPVHLNGDGNQSRGFTYVDDIARGTILGLKPLGYEIINLGGHEVISLNEMITNLEELLGRNANITKHPMSIADIPCSQADVKKAKRILNWQPKVNINDGMKELCNWYIAEREWASQVITD